MLGRKSVAQPVDQKLLQRRQVWAVLQFRPVQEMALHGTLDAGMNF